MTPSSTSREWNDTNGEYSRNSNERNRDTPRVSAGGGGATKSSYERRRNDLPSREREREREKTTTRVKLDVLTVG